MGTAPVWDADRYLHFGEQRTRAAIDLAAHVEITNPQVVVDLGCGPGNSTAVLRGKWPDAKLVGVDNAPEMIAAAQRDYPDLEFVVANAEEFKVTASVLFANASLMWMSNHQRLIPRLLGQVHAGGALAFQVPSASFAEIRKIIHAVSLDERWSQRMAAARESLTLHPADFYYDLLAPAARVDMWETEYYHVMESADAVVDWIAGTGMRPFIQALEGDERTDFESKVRAAARRAYTRQVDGRVLFPFRRLFVVAYK